MTPDFREIHLFPKKQTILGLVFSIILVSLTFFVIQHMWSALKGINSYHFPMVERSSINVRLVNLINYQFDLLKETQTSSHRKKIISDLNLNLQTLEQNYINFQSKTGQLPQLEVFTIGKSIVKELSAGNTEKANKIIEKKKFLELLDEFAFQIYDATESMSLDRDKEMNTIEKIIVNTLIVASLFSLFIIYLSFIIYKRYNLNLSDRVFAEQKAVELSRQRQSLVHILCHDLGNPLSAIFGLLKTAHLLPAEEKENILATIEENTKESLEIIDVTRKMQAIESGKLEIEKKPTSLKECFERSIIVLASQVENKKIVFDTSDFQDAIVQADATCLVHSVLNNILSNAIKFSAEAGVITLKSENGADDTYTLHISDEGVGIPKSLLPHVFSEQTATTRTGTLGEKGTGFGMPLVKKFMTGFDGTIDLKSPVTGRNHGTQVSLTFKTSP